MKKSKEKFVKFINRNGEIIRGFSCFLIIYAILFGCIFLNVKVPTASMDPTIAAGTRLVGERVAYNNHDVKRKDVIMFRYPDYEKAMFVKRVIGLPGETVSVIKGDVYINGKKLNEQYLVNDHTGDYGPYYVPKAGDEVNVVDAQYDKAGNLISGSCFIGKYQVGEVEFSTTYDANGEVLKNSTEPGFIGKYCEKRNGKYYVKNDCYFCMGDNRDSSDDSRFWNNHYVTKEKIRCKLILNVSGGFKKIV